MNSHQRRVYRRKRYLKRGTNFWAVVADPSFKFEAGQHKNDEQQVISWFKMSIDIPPFNGRSEARKSLNNGIT